MPDFVAKEREVATDTDQPGAKVPEADDNGLRELGATEFYPRHWEYRHPKHTFDDLRRPGYFMDEARARLQVGDEIHYCMQGGNKLPSEWHRGVCVVEEKPNTKQRPLILAGYVRYSKPTPWRVGALEDEAKVKAV